MNVDKIDDDIKKTSGPSAPIIPIEFTPHDGKGPRATLTPKPIHFIVGVFLFISGFAGWFVLTAKSVFVEVNPITAEIEIEGGLHVRLGQRYLIRAGSYELGLSNEGYHDIETRLLVNTEQSQTHSYDLRKLPGLVSISTIELSGARVKIDGVDIGITPLIDVPVEPGEHQMTISLDRYLDYGEVIEIEGREVEQKYQASLQAAWADVSLSTTPSGADVLVDGEVIGSTPAKLEILQGRRDFTLKLAGHKAWQEEFEVIAGDDFTVPMIELEPADGLVFIRTTPTAASVTIGGEFKGLTPLEVALPPGKNHELTFFKSGYYATRSSIRTEPNEEREVNISLNPQTAQVSVIAQPVDAELYINGEFKGLANQTLELMAASQQIEIRKDGFVPYTTEFTSRPGLDQAIRVSLKSLEQARLEQIKPVIATPAGQELKLFYPGAFTMGASRREAGRRPNENLRDIQLERPFYIGFREVTNFEFRQFDDDHSSGTVSGVTLNNEAQPVVQVAWAQAASYCNWLSEQEGLPFFYNIEGEDIIGFNPEATGYRLPTEAEWAWIARTNGTGATSKYPWGDQLPPPENAGNFADITVQSYIGQVMFNYNDNYFATAPVASFSPNHYAIHDMAGNVSEWVHDYYGAVGSVGVEVDPLGPELGQFHTIRGSSWAHGAITEMRLSFRDFGEESRDDVGFRVARYLE